MRAYRFEHRYRDQNTIETVTFTSHDLTEVTSCARAILNTHGGSVTIIRIETDVELGTEVTSTSVAIVDDPDNA